MFVLLVYFSPAWKPPHARSWSSPLLPTPPKTPRPKPTTSNILGLTKEEINYFDDFFYGKKGAVIMSEYSMVTVYWKGIIHLFG